MSGQRHNRDKRGGRNTPRLTSALGVLRNASRSVLRGRRNVVVMTALTALLCLLLVPDLAFAQAAPPSAPAAAVAPTVVSTGAGPGLSLNIDTSAQGYSGAIKILLILGFLSFAPALILSMTSFTRIIVVLALMRQAVGVVQLPPTRVMVGLALFLTMFTMAPVYRAIDEQAITPYQEGKMDEVEMMTAAMGPMRSFMLRHTSEKDLVLFLDIMKAPTPATADDVPTVALVPAFMLSELKTAFQMGALLFIPFLVIDLVVAAVLMSMGMMMLPPATISLPLKLIVFVAVDGWGLVIASLAESLL